MNWNMIGHQWAVDLLKEHVAQGTLRHAYCFTGPEGVGRRTLALRLAQAINCPESPAPGEPCLTCRTCQQLERMQHPDLTVTQAPVRGGTLVVDQVREIERSLSLTPYVARYRVALILRFEEAHPSAANALLKTLEEPNPQVLLMLTAESPESMLPTIVSRCEVLRLRPPSYSEVSQGLQEQFGLPAERAEFLARISGARPGFALRLHQDPEQLEQRSTRLDEMIELLSSTRVHRFAYADTLSNLYKKKEKDAEQDKDLAVGRELIRQTLETWLSFWRDVLLCAAGADAPIANLDRAEQIERLAEQVGLAGAASAIRSLERTQQGLERNANTRLAFEVLFLDLPQVQA